MQEVSVQQLLTSIEFPQVLLLCLVYDGENFSDGFPHDFDFAEFVGGSASNLGYSQG